MDGIEIIRRRKTLSRVQNDPEPNNMNVNPLVEPVAAQSVEPVAAQSVEHIAALVEPLAALVEQLKTLREAVAAVEKTIAILNSSIIPPDVPEPQEYAPIVLIDLDDDDKE